MSFEEHIEVDAMVALAEKMSYVKNRAKLLFAFKKLFLALLGHSPFEDFSKGVSNVLRRIPDHHDRWTGRLDTLQAPTIGPSVGGRKEDLLSRAAMRHFVFAAFL